MRALKAVSAVVVCGLMCITAVPSHLFAADDSSGIEQLLFLEIPSVVTASKNAESTADAPSVVYVVTSDELKRSGARTLADALARVPGFQVTQRETSDLGSRGFTSDQIDKFVWLIDGVAITNIMQDGPWGMMDIPDMEMVDHIEIVKGPGSTLWGSSASLGVINIITKTGEQVNGLKPTVSYSTRDNQVITNVLYGGKTNTADYMFSLTYTKSNGYEDDPDHNTIYGWGGTTPNTSYTTSGPGGSNLDKGNEGPMLEMRPSYELYGKIKFDDGITVKTRASYTRENYMWNDNNDLDHQDTYFQHMFIDAEKENKLSDNTSLTTSITAHDLAYDRGVQVQAVNPLAQADIETKSEMGLTLESILRTTLSSNQNLVAGIRIQSVQFGPSQREQFVVGTESTTLNGGYPTGYKYVYVTDAGTDDTSSLYAEDTWKVTDKLSLVGGLSYQYDDYAAEGGELLPRASVIYKFDKEWTAKYCYNTGYELPPIDKEFHKMFGHVTKSEEIDESDAELSYITEKTRVTATAYYYMIFNYFTWSTVEQNNVLLAQGQYNAGEGKSDGCEIEVRHNLTKTLSIFGNFTYQDTKINGGTPIGTPTQLYDIGADYYLTKKTSIDLNVNGWFDMANTTDANGNVTNVWRGDGDELVNVALVTDDLAKDFTLTLFVHNLFDVKSPVGMTSWPGYTFAEGASYGIKLSYKI